MAGSEKTKRRTNPAHPAWRSDIKSIDLADVTLWPKVVTLGTQPKQKLRERGAIIPTNVSVCSNLICLLKAMVLKKLRSILKTFFAVRVDLDASEADPRIYR